MALATASRPKLLPRLVAALAGLAALTAIAYPAVVGYQFAGTLMAPTPFARPDAPEHYHLAYEKVDVVSPRSAAPLKGWLFPNPKAEGRAILFLHGWRSHKQHMLRPYLSWLAKRYTVLAFDHPGHGESPAGMTTLGDREREDAAAALALLRARGYSRIGVLGTSMGGTTAIGLAAQDLGVKAVVSEATFARQRDLPVGYLRGHGFFAPEAVAFATLVMLDWRTGRDLEAASAEQAIAKLSPRPVFLIHGDADHVVLPESAQRLFAAAHEPKSLWVVPHADHMSEDATCPHALQPAEYERRVTTFFDQNL
jgi:pimeloyl-ACP methyl ester carboxylesterase